MKGLLYKDILILVKQLKFVLLMVAVFCLVPDSTLGMSRFFLLYAAIFVPASLLAIDENCRWEGFSGFLPCSPRDIVLSKYIIGWLGLVFGGVFFVIGLRLPIGGERESLFSLVMVAGFALLVQGIIFPILFRFGSTKGRVVSMLAIIVLAVGTGLLNASPLAGLAADGSTMIWVLLVLGAAVCAVSIPVSARQYVIRQG